MKKIEKKLKQKFVELFDINKKEEVLDLKKTKKILFFKVELKIGEYIVSSFVFREIKRKYPHIKIEIFVGGTNTVKELLQYNQYIDSYEVFDRKKNIEKIQKIRKMLKKSKEEPYDILFDFSCENKISPKQMIFMRKMNSKLNMGYDKEKYNIYNKKISYQKGRMVEIWRKMLEEMGLNNLNLKYDIPISEESEKRVKKFFLENKIEKIIALNFFGSIPERKINTKNAIIILKKLREVYFDHDILILDSPSDRNEIHKILQEIKDEKVYFYQDSRTIMDAISIIRRSDLVISPDTSIVHIAEGLDKRIITFYSNDRENLEKNKVYEKSNIIIYDKRINDLDYEKIEYKIKS